MDNIRVELINLPTSIRAFTLSDRLNMYYTIFLNSRLSNEQNKLSYEHELEHIRNGDFDMDCNVDKLELDTHNFNKENTYEY